ncbi:MAG: hypothetical protein QW666_03520 [Candidatus Woesearchaeota archaeon]
MFVIKRIAQIFVDNGKIFQDKKEGLAAFEQGAANAVDYQDLIVFRSMILKIASSIMC